MWTTGGAAGMSADRQSRRATVFHLKTRREAH